LVKTGLERFLTNPPAYAKHASLGLLANQASVGPNLDHAVQLIDRFLPGRLKSLFGPQHGFAGEKQDNMIESDNRLEPGTRRNIFSLYGQTRRPTAEMLAGLDVLVIDLVDVGTRVYTFASTMAYCLEEAARLGLKVVLLDRPNPIGGSQVEGNLLKPDCASFVGLFPIPMRHGMTMGELAKFMADRLDPIHDFEVIPLSGWQRDMYFPQTGLPWVMPSPNMPAPETALVYPGQVIWEGTNISEGRGTTRPFHLCGAPFIDSQQFKKEMDNYDLPGIRFRAASFEPTFNKHQGQLCHGLEIHVIDRFRYQPYMTTLTMLEVLWRLYPEEIAWKESPYEYEYQRCPLRLGIEQGRSAADLARDWRKELDLFHEEREKYLLYQ